MTMREYDPAVSIAPHEWRFDPASAGGICWRCHTPRSPEAEEEVCFGRELADYVKVARILIGQNKRQP